MKGLIYKVAHRVLSLYWFLFQPKTFGVRILIGHQNKFLFIRHTYGEPLWYIPGGGIKVGEALEAAAKREIFEEVGISVSGLEYLGEFYSEEEYKKDTVYLFHAEITDPKYVSDNKEIAEARWFERDALPPRLSRVAKRAVELFGARFI